jgi:Trk K+ transport system NAD-binding subunit
MIINANKNKTGVWERIAYFVFILSSLIFGYIGYYLLNIKNSDIDYSITEMLYQTIRLFILENDFEEYETIPPLLNFVRFFAPIALILPILKILGVLINNTWALISIKFSKNHTVFCGLGLKAKMVIEAKRYGSKNIVIIEKNPDNIYINSINDKVKGIKIIIGDAADKSVLEKANVAGAENIFVNTGNDIINLDVLSMLQQIYDDENPKKEHNVIVDLTEHYNERFFKQFEDKKNDSLNIHSFNIYKRFSAKIVDEYSPDKFISIKSKDDDSASILIYGMNKLGENLILEAAQIYNFVNLKKTKIYVVDLDIEYKKELFLTVFPNIDKAVQLDFFGEKDFIKLIEENPLLHNISVCFICSENDSQNFIVAQRLRQLFWKKEFQMKNQSLDSIFTLPKVVMLSNNYNQIVNSFDNFRGEESKLEKLNISYHNIFEEISLLLDGNYDDIAKVIHQKYSSLESSEIDKKWEGLTDEQKDFNRWAARHLKVKLRYFNLEIVEKDNSSELDSIEFSFTKENKDILAEWEHFRWCAEKYLTGFVPGEYISNEEQSQNLKNNLKWHKSLVSWEKLKKTDQDKDYGLTKLNEIIDELKNTYTLVKIK